MQEKFDKGLNYDTDVPVLLAVSGGVDSMSMAELFFRSSLHPSFALAHCNFSLRGEESDGDEELVTSWAETHGVRLYKIRFDTVLYAKEHNVSIEMAARDLRYSWFAELCVENGFGAVAVAHNANDNAETLFLNILRGTGVRGLAGMSFSSRLPCNPEILLLRPLLQFTRKQIEGYAFAEGVAFRNDHTNFETEYKRNRIRNQVFPLFEKINPSFIRTVNHEMAYFSDAEDILSAYFHERQESLVTPHCEGLSGGIEVDIRALMKDAHWKYLLYRILEPYGFNSQVLSSLEDLLRSGRTLSGKVFVSKTFRLVTTSDKIVVVAGEYGQEDVPVVVNGPGVYEFRGRKYEVCTAVLSEGFDLKAPKDTLFFAGEAIPFPFYFRTWANGDWFIPFGMKGRKKVSDFFTDRKMSVIEKENCPVLSKSPESRGGRVSAVLCYRIDDSVRLTERTSEVLVIRKLS